MANAAVVVSIVLKKLIIIEQVDAQITIVKNLCTTMCVAWKYCSEIMYALEKIRLSRYPAYNILSIGCGGAPDLMAFEETMKAGNIKNIFYKGYDINQYWNPIHRAIKEYSSFITTEFINRDIFDVLNDEKQDVHHYNVIVLEYLLSHFPPDNRMNLASVLFSKLIEIVLSNRLSNSPFLFIINDIDHYEVRPLFGTLLDKLNNERYCFSSYKFHFKNRSSDYGDRSERHLSDQNKFLIPDKIKSEFNCAINCSSAQLIVEVF